MTCRYTSYAVVIILCCAHLSGCDALEPPEPEVSGSPLGLVWLEAYQKSDLATSPASERHINLGDVPWGRDFVFVLTNSGHVPVEHVDVEVVSAPDGISITPDHFELVLPPGADGVTATMRMTVEHGKNVRGLGMHAPLEMGTHIIRLRLSGDIASGTTRRTVSTEIALELNAVVMDLLITDDLGEVSRETRPSGIVLGLSLVDWATTIDVFGAVRVSNSGNSIVDVQFSTPDPENRNIFTGVNYSVAPEETVILDRVEEGLLRIDLNDAASDPANYPPHTGNFSYLWLKRELEGGR